MEKPSLGQSVLNASQSDEFSRGISRPMNIQHILSWKRLVSSLEARACRYGFRNDDWLFLFLVWRMCWMAMNSLNKERNWVRDFWNVISMSISTG